jgi:hypothetical protein
MRSSARTILSILIVLTFPSVLIAQGTNQNGPSNYPPPFALLALNDIDFKGNFAMTDSFNSQYGSYTNSPHGAHGNVVSLYGLVNVGNADIYGDVLFGANNTNSLQSVTNSIGSSGRVTGAIGNCMNIDLPAVILPNDFHSFGAPPSAYPDYTYVTPTSGDYTLTGLTGSLIVPSNRTVRLYISGNVSISIPPGITVQPGGQLTLYMGGSSFTVSGTGTINAGGTAANFSYLGLLGNTSITLTGNTSFTGTIYAPYAGLSFSSGNPGMCGSMLVKSAVVSGSGSFHYDESLQSIGATPPPLSISIAGTSVTLVWPSQYSNYVLQASTDLQSGTWDTNMPQPIIVGTNLQLTLPMTNQQQFYRLSR